MKRLFLSFIVFISFSIMLISCNIPDTSGDEFAAYLIGDWDAVYFITNLVTNKTGYPPDITVTVPITNYFPLVTTISISNDSTNTRSVSFTTNAYIETDILTGNSPSTNSIVRDWEIIIQTGGYTNLSLYYEVVEGDTVIGYITLEDIGMKGELLEINTVTYKRRR